MKLFSAVAVLIAGTGAWASDGAHTPKRVVTACLNVAESVKIMYPGQATATQILSQVGVQLEWRIDQRACAEGKGIVVTISRETPLNQYPGALAYARPFDRTHIVVFYDRVLSAAGPALAPRLLGHVLAHEIVHMLQGIDRHSTSGIMKPRWDKRDYDDMRRANLPFTPEDIGLIERGLAWRAARAVPAE